MARSAGGCYPAAMDDTTQLLFAFAVACGATACIVGGMLLLKRWVR